MRVILVLCAVIILGGLGAGAYRWMRSAPIIVTDQFYTVVRKDLDILIQKDGELQAVNNLDVVCPVEGLNTIRTIVPEGSMVKKGDLLAELDSSDMKTKLQSAMLDVQKAESDATAAKAALAIQKNQNAADLDAANVELKLAKIDLKAYTEGTYPQSLQAATRDVELAKIAVDDKQQVLTDSKALQAKGFITTSDVRKAEEDLVTAQSDLEKKTADLRVLTDYTHEKDLADNENKVAQAEKKVQRTIAENDSNLSQKISDSQTKDQALLLYKQTLKHIQEQVDACTIKAPGDGVVIYGSSAMPDWYRETPIQPGAKIEEQQLLIRLPDTSHMKAVVKIPEAMALKLRGTKISELKASVSVVGLADPVPAAVTAISVLPDNSNRWWDPDHKDYPVDLTLTNTPPNLKPGVTARGMIVLAHLSEVMAAPLSAIYSDGDDHYVFILRGNEKQPQRISIGQVTDTDAEILSGVAEGDQLLILQAGQGREMLEKAGIVTHSTTKPATPMAVPTTNPTTQALAAPKIPPTSRPATQPMT